MKRTTNLLDLHFHISGPEVPPMQGVVALRDQLPSEMQDGFLIPTIKKNHHKMKKFLYIYKNEMSVCANHLNYFHHMWYTHAHA